MEAAKYVAHPHYAQKLEGWVKMAAEIEGSEGLRFDVTALQTGQELALPSGHIVRPFPTAHTLPSQVGRRLMRGASGLKVAAQAHPLTVPPLTPQPPTPSSPPPPTHTPHPQRATSSTRTARSSRPSWWGARGTRSRRCGRRGRR
jgi:hypothetical protein